MPNLNTFLRNPFDLGNVICQFSALVGYKPLSKAVEKIEYQLARRKIETDQLLDRYAVAIGLHRARSYKSARGRWPKPTEQAHFFKAYTFAASAVAISRLLSSKARTKLVGRIIDALKWGGDPRPLQIEFLAANNFAQKGWNVFFTDLEGQEEFDLLIKKGETAIEVECKTVSGDLGNAVHHMNALNFFENNLDALKPFSNGCCRIFHFVFEDRLPNSIEEQNSIIQAALRTAQENHEVFEIDGCRIEMREEAFPFGSKNIREIQQFARESVEHLQRRMNGQAVAVFGANGILSLCLSSQRKSRLQDYVAKSTKRAAKQLSGSRPGYVWTHFIDLRNDHIKQLARKSGSREPTGLEGISQCVFDSDGRQHLFALGYSAVPPVFRSQRVEGYNLVTKLGQEGALIIHKNRRSTFSVPENSSFP